MPPNRFILFALARTGSTTLMQILNCHPDIRCLYEPFNPGNHAEYRRLVDLEHRLWGLPSALELLWQHCNSFKHVCHPDGWPFIEQPDLNQQLLRVPSTKVLLLSRKNRLQRALSVQISDQMQVWNTQTPEDRQRIRRHQFAPLNIPKLQIEMDHDFPMLRQARQTLAAAGTLFHELTYEDLFDPAIALEVRLHSIQSILAFLGFPPLTDSDCLHQLKQLFDPAATGFQNAAAYHKIPNIHEVDRLLGSPESGFVFDPPAAQSS